MDDAPHARAARARAAGDRRRRARGVRRGVPAVAALAPPRAATLAARYAIVCLPSIEWGFRMQRPQQLARRFAQSGSDVLFARHSFGVQLAARQAEPGIEEIELPGVPGTNPYRDRMGDEEAHRAADALLGHLAARGVGRFVCVVQLPFWAPLAARLREVAGCDVVYDCMDLHAGFSSNSAEALADEARLFAESDVVVCSAELLAEHARPHAKAVALVRNGVDYEHFAAVPDREPAPRAVAHRRLLRRDRRLVRQRAGGGHRPPAPAVADRAHRQHLVRGHRAAGGRGRTSSSPARSRTPSSPRSSPTGIAASSRSSTRRSPPRRTRSRSTRCSRPASRW